jgi:hypothetical protein
MRMLSAARCRHGGVSLPSAARMPCCASANNHGRVPCGAVRVCLRARAGKLKSEPLQRHINTYAAGKKCVAQVVLDGSTDLSRMRVAQLKARVAAKGVDCSGCFEKADYVAALKGWLERQQQQQDQGSGTGKEEL